MYESYYGFSEKPFSLLPDPRFLYLGSKHDTALNLLQYSLLNPSGFTVLSGDIGSGKTTLIRALLNRLEPDLTVGLITNTHPSFGALLNWVLMAFDLDHQQIDEVDRYRRFIDFLTEEYAQGRRTVLIVDEAQNMTPAMLEELRLLSNVNADDNQVLQLVLVGQPQLRTTMANPSLVQFTQRVAVSYHLRPLNQAETRTYVRHRLKIAGGVRDPFGTTAHAVIYHYSGGVPRLVNLLCDTALVYGYGARRKRLDAALVEELVRDRLERGLLPSAPMQAASTATEHSRPWSK